MKKLHQVSAVTGSTSITPDFSKLISSRIEERSKEEQRICDELLSNAHFGLAGELADLLSLPKDKITVMQVKFVSSVSSVFIM